ncbi:MAG: hypothetical protein WAW11_02825 [Patescibacteria group bacterium]
MNNDTRFIMAYKGMPANIIIGTSDKIKKYSRSVICIKEDDKIYKIISFSSSPKDGSINVFFPYCSEKDAYIFQFKHIYKPGIERITKNNLRKEYTVNRETKLSIHSSGFVQLSGNGIKSGIDLETGSPKGVGVFSSPLSQPVNSGPTTVFSCWNIKNGFEELTKKKSNTQYIVLDSKDFHDRPTKNKGTSTRYTLEFFIFPSEANEYVYEHNGGCFIDHRMDTYIHNPGVRFTHPVLDFKNFNGVVAVFPCIINDKIGENEPSGYFLSSPGGRSNIKEDSEGGNIFMIRCPRKTLKCDEDKEFDSLEFKD